MTALVLYVVERTPRPSFMPKGVSVSIMRMKGVSLEFVQFSLDTIGRDGLDPYDEPETDDHGKA